MKADSAAADHDVHLVQLDGGDLTITGCEEIEDREGAQSWFCRIARDDMRPRGRPDEPVGRVTD